MTDTAIDPPALKNCLRKAGEYLEQNHVLLNRLNVFPVPDGDTGTNMLSTFEAGIRSLEAESAGRNGSETIDSIALSMNDELIKHSRGNSGFILARFFHGFFDANRGVPVLGVEEFTSGFAGGLFQVHSSLFTPVEGTMLTVIRGMSNVFKSCKHNGNRGKSLSEALSSAIDAGREALAETPRLLPVLAKAGVPDSGALGFIFLMDGFYRGLTGESVLYEREEDYRFAPILTATASPAPVDTRSFGFCTEVTVGAPKPFSKEELSSFLEERGNSIALVCEEKFLKVHIHTDNPDEVVAFLSSIGSVDHMKIDNLGEQVSRFRAAENPEADCGLLAFVPGEGFEEIFRSIEVQHCFAYSSHLPSTGEILERVESLPEENIIILPNHTNILPAVMAASEKTSKHAAVIHSENIVQGLTAAYGYSGNDTIEENVGSMKDCLSLAVGLFIYRAAAESSFDGHCLRQGDYFAMSGGSLVAQGEGLQAVAVESIVRTKGAETCNISVFYRDEDSLHELHEGTSFAEALSEAMKEMTPPEIEYLYGGQSREALILSLE